ncbi:neuronal acetylcholine receptor subunit alpha-7a isoform X3 [Tachysurus fulvidraco]|uniref:neuronal acetylcholine receptor subunit alpha-7a isoform X3 n=1 Tax=Tachysurus fulvidraco TaxID=1234273 RepID=UPI000F4D8EB3|nr:neuronal acetylcholine receptor subunit alpha-7a isoform X3 [Tachysurus fulvidraco]
MGICGFAFCLAITTCLWRASIQGEHQRRLYRDLMKDYNPLERPVFNDTQSLTVNFSFSLMQIMDVDEKNQVLTTNIWLQLYWFDHYLKWNVSEYPGVTSVRFPDSQIWKPDILLYNSADERFDATFHTNVLVSSNGACQYLPPGIFKSTCHIDVRWFPFDVQRCDLKFGSWTYGGWSLDLQMIEADITGYIANGEWDLVEVPGRRNERFYDCCKEPYPDVTFTVVMRRRTLYYGLNLLIPCVLISTLALLVFLLPADSGEKISLGITVLLSLTVFMLLVAEIMPATSDSVPLIDTCGAGELVRLVLADEKAGREASVLSMPRQASTQQRLQCRTDQWKHSLHGPAWYGEPALCHVTRLWGGVRTPDGCIRRSSVSEQRSGRHRAVQDPGRGALHY